jgi:hypothetical protein
MLTAITLPLLGLIKKNMRQIDMHLRFLTPHVLLTFSGTSDRGTPPPVSYIRHFLETCSSSQGFIQGL